MGRIDFSKKIKKIVKKRVSYIKYILKKRNALHLSDNTIKDVSDSSSAKIAIHFHIFYIDLIDEIYEYLANIKNHFTLIITVVNEKDYQVLSNFFKLHQHSYDLKIIIVQNRGRDIYPFYLALHNSYKDYDIIAHFHTKRSFHTDYGEKWRKYLFNNLIGKKCLFDNIINYFCRNQNVGFVTTPIVPINAIISSYYDFIENIDENKSNIINTLNVFGVPSDLVNSNKFVLDFPCGNMFIARSEAIKQFFSVNLTENDFPEEQGQLSGTLQHYVELIWNYVVKYNNYLYKEIIRK